MQRTQKPLPSAPLLLCSSAPEAALMISLSPDTILHIHAILVQSWTRSFDSLDKYLPIWKYLYFYGVPNQHHYPMGATITSDHMDG